MNDSTNSMDNGAINGQISLVERLFRNEGFLTRTSVDDAPFWYTSNEPGPFYIFSHRVIGRDIADHLLDFITLQMKEGTQKHVFNIAAEIDNCISDPQYNLVTEEIARMGFVDNGEFASRPISGGERKDWIFSHPLAKKAELPHFWLTKSHNCFLQDSTAAGKSIGTNVGNDVTHVTDIVHKGASFFDSWLPALQNSDLNLKHIFSVFCRSQIGRDRLIKENFPFTISEDIDLPRIKTVERAGVISRAIYDDISLFFEDRAAWMRRFIETADSNAVIDQLGSRDRDRILKFFQNDPYDLGTSHPEQFTAIKTKIEEAKHLTA